MEKTEEILEVSLFIAQQIELLKPVPGFFKEWLRTRFPSGATPLHLAMRAQFIDPQDRKDIIALFGATDLDMSTITEHNDSVYNAVMAWVSTKTSPQDLRVVLKFLVAIDYVQQARELLISHINCVGLADIVTKEELYEMLFSPDTVFRTEGETVLQNPLGFQRSLPLLKILTQREGGSSLARQLLLFRNSQGMPAHVTLFQQMIFDAPVDYSQVLHWLAPEDARIVLGQPLSDDSTNSPLLLALISSRRIVEPINIITLDKALIKKLYDVEYDFTSHLEVFEGYNISLFPQLPQVRPFPDTFFDQPVDVRNQQIKALINSILFVRALGLNFLRIIQSLPQAVVDLMYDQAPEALQVFLLLKDSQMYLAHMHAGANMVVPVPKPVAFTSTQFIGRPPREYPEFYSFIADSIEGADQELGLTPAQKTNLLEWENKIRTNTMIYGMDKNEENERSNTKIIAPI